MTIEELKQQINTFDISVKSSSDLAEAYKMAKGLQEAYKPNSDEFKLLEHFKSDLQKQIRSIRPKPTKEVVYEATPES